MSQSVAITGCGVLSALGASHTQTLAAMRAGDRAKGEPLPVFSDTPFAAYRVAALPEFFPETSAQHRRMRKFMAPQSELAAMAAHEAIVAAGLETGRVEATRIGLFAGIGLAAVDPDAGAELLHHSLDAAGAFCPKLFAANGLPGINPLWSFRVLANMPACIVSVLEGIGGANLIFTPWEDQTGAAILEAAAALWRNEVDAAVVVAADIPSHPANLAELAASGRIRQTEIAAPGAGCLVLERVEDARGRPHAVVSQLDLQCLPTERSNNDIATDCSGKGCASPLTAESGHLLTRRHSILDPLAPYIGRTIAAAPVILMALAPFLPGLSRSECAGPLHSGETNFLEPTGESPSLSDDSGHFWLDGSGGQRFSFCCSPWGNE